MKSGLYTNEIILLWPTNLAKTKIVKNFKDLKIGYNEPILYKPCLEKKKYRM